MRKGVQRLFSEVAKTYELVNHILTFGLDMAWRRKAAREAAKAGGNLWLDVCSGTGEMALNLSRLADETVKIISVDFSDSMLARGLKTRTIHQLSWVMADAVHLPFTDDSFDLVTISFATRNININREILVAHFKEFRRVLKPGGCFINLETSQPSKKIIQKLFHFYIKSAVKPLGYVISGSKAGYTYLSHTIPRFYSAKRLASLLLESGFKKVIHRPLFLGVSAIHTAWK